MIYVFVVAEMDILPLLSKALLWMTIAINMAGVWAYAAFKLRERLKPKKNTLAPRETQPGTAPIFLTRYMPTGSTTSPPLLNKDKSE